MTMTNKTQTEIQKNPRNETSSSVTNEFNVINEKSKSSNKIHFISGAMLVLGFILLMTIIANYSPKEAHNTEITTTTEAVEALEPVDLQSEHTESAENSGESDQ